MSRNTNQAKALIDAWFILLRYKWRFIFPLFMVSTTILALSLLLPRKYQAEAVFDRRTDQILASIMVGGAAKTFSKHNASIRHELSSGVTLDNAFNDIRPYIDARVKAGGDDVDWVALRQDFSHKIQIKFEISTPEHERVSVKYVGADPVISRLAVNQLVSNYIKHARVEIAHSMEEAQGFFNDEVERTRIKIESLENQKLAHEIKHFQLLPDSPNNINVLQAQVDEQIATLKRQISLVKSQVSSHQKALNETSRTIDTLVKARNPELIRLESKLRELHNTYRTAVIVNKMTQMHPEVMDLKIQINDVQVKIQNTPVEVVTSKTVVNNNHFDDLTLALNTGMDQQTALEEELVKLAQNRVSLIAKTADIFPVRSQYRKINRQMDQLQRELQFWEENLRRIQMARSAENGNRGVQLAFIRPCDAITRPIAPNMLQIVISAIGLGLIAGAVSLLFAHRTDETFHDGEQLSKTFNLPLLGEVSEIVSVQHRRMRKIRNMVLYPVNAVAMTAVLGTLISVLYLNLQKPHPQDSFKEDPMEFIQKIAQKSNHAETLSVEPRQAD